MKRNFEPAFMGHPGVDPLASRARSHFAAHANFVLSANIEYRLTFRDGVKSKWMPVSRGAMSMPPAADLIELRRKA